MLLQNCMLSMSDNSGDLKLLSVLGLFGLFQTVKGSYWACQGEK